MFIKVSNEQIEAWKKKHVEGVLAWETQEGKVYFKNPNKSEKYFHTIKRALVFQQNKDLVSAGEVIFNACYLGGLGDLNNIEKNHPSYVGACLACTDLIEITEGNFTAA
ncbi:hypothetical protein [Aureispira sp. CCB-QB1]|uniref:hypothetical protein n=1 Tax=Aureispira sp. CCB-QB1 TaxID=1313421 RepID=UPI00069733F6|nr:hypothetical protein [Aureispira sp. CCB-QB1]